MEFPRLSSIKIEGFKAFKDFKAELGALEVIVGANGTEMITHLHSAHATAMPHIRHGPNRKTLYQTLWRANIPERDSTRRDVNRR